MNITGKTLIDWGYTPGNWFGDAIKTANTAVDESSAKMIVESFVPEISPTIPLRSEANPYYTNIRAETEHEVDNLNSVFSHMNELMKLPTAVSGAIMPDACPAGSQLGTIPVGGVVATNNAIHPGMHSADICCSMSISIFDKNVDPTKLLDAGMKLSHFGGGGRGRDSWKPHSSIVDKFENNNFLKAQNIIDSAIDHFGTQGDGNHFFYVGRIKSTDQIALVTHHGSRRPGALLYKAGMTVAEKYRRKICPEAGKHNAWIPADTSEGGDYWEALQIVRMWTKANHNIIHDKVSESIGAKVSTRFWNEHNFVFRKSDGLFYHGKGATPAFDNWANDSNGLSLIPMNMAEPILITRGLDAKNGLGFSPHGAGRNFSRTQYMRQNEGKTVHEMMKEQTKGLDIRFFHDKPDASELPGAYKNAESVRRQIDEYGLAEVVDTVEPIGSIMAGDWQSDAPWKTKKRS